MTGVWLFLHLLGVVLWLGLAVSLTFVTVRAGRSEDPAVTRFGYRTNASLMSTLGLAGMVLTVGGGFALTEAMGYGYFQPFPRHWLFQMQLLGVVAFLIGVFYEIPLSRKLARVAEEVEIAGEVAEDVELDDVRRDEDTDGGTDEPGASDLERLRKRRAIVGSINGTILLAVLILAALKP